MSLHTRAWIDISRCSKMGSWLFGKAGKLHCQICNVLDTLVIATLFELAHRSLCEVGGNWQWTGTGYLWIKCSNSLVMSNTTPVMYYIFCSMVCICISSMDHLPPPHQVRSVAKTWYRCRKLRRVCSYGFGHTKLLNSTMQTEYN